MPLRLQTDLARSIRRLAGRAIRAALGLAALALTAAGCKDRHEVEITPGPPRLVGDVFRPTGEGPFPAILYNHGSEPDPDRPPRLAEYFTARGFVFFTPFRRGRPPSGGRHEKALLDRTPPDQRAAVFVRELESQVEEILSGLAWLERQPYVDRKRIAVAGHSLGGVLVLLTAERKTDIMAGLSLGAGIPGWNSNPLLKQRMIDAAAASTIPVLILQAENDYALAAPTLGEAMSRAGRPGRVKVYPPVGTTPREGHGGFTLSPQIWGEEAIGFLRESLR